MPVTATAMKAILDYAYLGQMKLNTTNAVEVLRAIDFFSMMNVMEICADFVVAHAMTVNNVIPLRSFFIAARLCGHKDSANNFIKVIAILISYTQSIFIAKLRNNYVKRSIFAIQNH